MKIINLYLTILVYAKIYFQFLH